MSHRERSRFQYVIAIATGAVACASLLMPATGSAASCEQPAGRLEPPCNPALAQSPWSASHRGSYAQASSPFRGLESGKVRAKHIPLPGIPISVQFSDRYDGGREAWGSLIDGADRKGLFKVDVRSGKLIDLYVPAEREPGDTSSGATGITGSYNMLDRSNHFIVPRQRRFDVYGDAKRGDRNSKIKLLHRFDIPDRGFCGPDDKLVGATMTYDGYLAFATERGVVGTVPRKLGRMNESNLRTVSINGAACEESDPYASEADLETVSNNIAADEKGGIYVVTSSQMRRFNHNAKKNVLKSRWSSSYDAGSEVSEIRLGAGSGSTPTLMGVGRQDKFVVITDGQDLMHVDLFWRNGIPKDWDGLGGGRPERLACEYPVSFGDPNASVSLSEQSVAVRGYGTLHVQNLLDYEFPDNIPGVLLNALAALRGGDPAVAPHGMERIDWDPKKQRCRTAWVNEKVSVPNGIPSISQPSDMAYGMGQRKGRWGVEGVDWTNGKSRFFARAPKALCGDIEFGYLDTSGTRPILGPTVEELPRSCENSFYAATEIAPGNSIWTGTFLGLTMYRPKR